MTLLTKITLSVVGTMFLGGVLATALHLLGWTPFSLNSLLGSSLLVFLGVLHS